MLQYIQNIFYCSKECYTKAHKQKQIKRLSSLPKCKTDGCNNKATRIGLGICETCYYRIRRKGNTDKRTPNYRYKTGAGYIKLHIPNHPIADNGGNIFEHRKVHKTKCF